MKKLFAVILSLGLILAPMPVLNDAHAQSKGGSYAKMILGLANGIVGTVIITNCKPVMNAFDHYIYMAGSLVYVAGEILTGKQKGADIAGNQKFIDECMAKTKKTEGGELQRCSLEAQKHDEESTKEFIEKKMKWTTATLVVYSLAAIATGVELVCDVTVPAPFCAGTLGSTMICNPSNASMAVQLGVVAAFGYASGGLLGAAMAAGMKYFAAQLSIGTGIVDKLMTAMSSGYYRLAFYIAAGVLVGVILSDLSKQKKESEKRIADIQKMIDTLEAADNNLEKGDSQTTAGVASGGLGGNGNQNGPKKYEVKSLAAGTQLAKHCWSGSGASTNFSEGGCNQPLRLNKPTFPAGMNIPSMTDGTNAAIDMANAISSGDVAGADVQAGKLIAMAGKINKVKDGLLAKINADLVKNGKKPIDGKDIVKQQVDSLNAALNKQNPGSGNVNLADIENAGAAGVSEAIPAAEVPMATAITAAPAIDPNAATGLDLSGLDDGAGAEDAANAATEKVATLEDSLNQYESNESDISKDSGVSIFKQVSNRYILNYEKIFNRKQINPPLAEPQPSK